MAAVKYRASGVRVNQFAEHGGEKDRLILCSSVRVYMYIKLYIYMHLSVVEIVYYKIDAP